ncbi:hypothetical protein T459_16286 [Capsicum annuum]|uniref:Uncharacterized protein n=1 Tax=Capsicum annuum TaxID=4072 RepID=A0A2G2Z8E0_CAPAN|nr:hypothetical protein T459_16286 [Capsicum annuum]
MKECHVTNENFNLEAVKNKGNTGPKGKRRWYSRANRRMYGSFVPFPIVEGHSSSCQRILPAHSYTADEAAVVLHQAGAISIIKSTPESAEDAEVGKYKSNLLIRFQDLSYDIRS